MKVFVLMIMFNHHPAIPGAYSNMDACVQDGNYFVMKNKNIWDFKRDYYKCYDLKLNVE